MFVYISRKIFFFLKKGGGGGGYNQVIFWPEVQNFSGGAIMKKVIASLLVLLLGASMVMAEMPVPGSAPQQTAAAVAFADVEGIALGEQDSAAVKGGMGQRDLNRDYEKKEVTIVRSIDIGFYKEQVTEKWVKKESASSTSNRNRDSISGEKRKGGRITY